MNNMFNNKNSKLSKEKIYSFGLQPGKTCKNAGICKNICYGLKGNYRFPSHLIKYNNNLILTKKNNFIDLCINDIVKRKIKCIRWHDTGDIYNQAYLSKIETIAQKTQKYNCFHYAYTKMVNLKYRPIDNFKIIFSFGGKYDNKININRPHSRIFYNLEDMRKKKYIDCSRSDKKAIKNIRIGLLYH